MVKLNLEFPENFFEQEVRSDYTITKEMKKVWAVELDLLKKLDEVCKKHNITYYADGGTLLGAIRHKGFIPWDDDIDVVMFREDYDRFLKIAKKEFKHPYFLQSVYSDINYYRGHAQLRNSETTGMLPHEMDKVEFNQGIFLDIFPLDYISKYNLFGKLKHMELKIYFKLLYWGYSKNAVELCKNPIKKQVKKIIRYFFKNMNGVNLYRHIEKRAKKTLFKSRSVTKSLFFCISRKFERYYIIPQTWFGTPKYVSFENIMVPIPKNADAVLRVYYGDDYIIPLKQKSMHGELILDADKSYIETLKEIT